MLVVTATLIISVSKMMSLSAECQSFLTIYFIITFFELIMSSCTMRSPVRNKVIIGINLYTAQKIYNLLQTGEVHSYIIINLDIVYFFQCSDGTVNTVNTCMSQFIRHTA